MGISDSFVPENSIQREATKRLSEYVRVSIPPALREEYEDEKWVLDRRLKKSLRMRRVKSHDVMFEDRVWAMFARLGFTGLNRGRNFTLAYGDARNELKQIDVLAVDEDVVLVIECKSSGATQPPSHAFKTEVEAIRGYREGVIRSLREEFPAHKVKFILATNNILVSDDTAERVEAAGIAILDEEAVEYYLELSAHLGKAAKYQLLGTLFQGTKISGLQPTVPALQGRMGGYVYYSFAIEPARLLKVAYVLHRSKANTRWMPTYQRIIKKPRLKKVSEFVDNGGFFPNSIVLNIDSGGKKLRFDRASSQDGASRLGFLHLPQNYRSAYVIDGQHRLYGYANSDRAATELIPVVAFVDLPPTEQVQLFMQINENQQAVPKNLRNTLNSDLLWDSADLRERARALKLRVAQSLGEGKSSPLRGRVVIGEDKATALRCISIDAISRGIDRGNFIGTFSNSEMRTAGTFYRGGNDQTLKPLVTFFELSFQHLRDELPDQWNVGRGEGGFVFTNNGVEAMMRLLGDLVEHAASGGLVDPRTANPRDTYIHVREMLVPLVKYLRGLSLEESLELKKMYGSAAATRYWRRFQTAVAAEISSFQPAGLAEYLDDQAKQFNTDSFAIIRDIEIHLKDDVRRRLEDQYGASWYKTAVPQKVYQDAVRMAADKKWAASTDEEVDWWDCLHLSDYHQIFTYRQEIWNSVFEAAYTAPSDEKKAWKSKSSWMDRLIKIRNANAHEYSVSEDEFEFLTALHSWLGLSGTGRND